MNGNIFMLFVLLTSINEANPIQIRSINSGIFIPLSASNFTTVHNRSKDECLCLTLQYLTVMNFFLNGTCQIFALIPCAYQVRLQTQVELYLLNQSISLAPQSCASNLTLLLNKLNNTVPISSYAVTPRCLVIDNHGYLVTVHYIQSLLIRYNPINLTVIDQTSLTLLSLFTIAFHNGTYYVASQSGNITIINSTTLATINTIYSPYISKPRDIIFIKNGYTMIVASLGNNRIVFFNRLNISSINYIYTYEVPFSHQDPYGLWRVNDSFFYATSYKNNTIFSYSLINNTTWRGNLVVDARNKVSISGGTHVTIDPHNRLWFSLENGSVLIYDDRGIFLNRFHSSVPVHDLLITENYTIYISSLLSNRLLRFDPNIND